MIYQSRGCGGGGGGGGEGREGDGGKKWVVNWRHEVFEGVEELWTCTMAGYGRSSIADLVFGYGDGRGGKLRRVALWCSEVYLDSCIAEVEATFFKPSPPPSSPSSSSSSAFLSHRPPAIHQLSALVLHVRSQAYYLAHEKSALKSGHGVSWMDAFRPPSHSSSSSSSHSSSTISLLREEKFFIVPVTSKRGRLEWSSLVDEGGGGGKAKDLWTRAREWRVLAGDAYELVMPDVSGDPDPCVDMIMGRSMAMDVDVGMGMGMAWTRPGPSPLGQYAYIPGAIDTTSNTSDTTVRLLPSWSYVPQAQVQNPTIHDHHRRAWSERQARRDMMDQIWESEEQEAKRADEERWFKGGEWELEGGEGGVGAGGDGGGGGGASGRGCGEWGTDTRELCSAFLFWLSCGGCERG